MKVVVKGPDDLKIKYDRDITNNLSKYQKGLSRNIAF